MERTSDTDMNPDGSEGTDGSEHGDGTGNDEANRPITDVDEQTGRPTGTSTPDDWTGVGGDEPIDEESPTLPPA